jgi:cytochrome c peroxidase
MSLLFRALARVAGAFASGAPAAAADLSPAPAGLSLSELRDRYPHNDKARCAVCHEGWNFTDGAFHDLGLLSPDRGLGVQPPGILPMQHAFKTPTLRDADRRAPYIHDGSVATPTKVVDLYTHARQPRPSVSLDAPPVALTAREKDDLLAFLRTLTGDAPPVTMPVLPR